MFKHYHNIYKDNINVKVVLPLQRALVYLYVEEARNIVTEMNRYV